MRSKIFIIAFVVSCILQTIIWTRIQYYDESMWTSQAQYVNDNDERQYNASEAYGHPGGPIILETIAIHQLLGVSYNDALNIYLVISNSLIIAFICVLCYMIKPKHLWWISVLSTLSINRLWQYTTPPSASVSMFVLLLTTLTLYMYKKNDVRLKTLLMFGFISGLTIATRVDIGVFMTMGMLIILWPKINIKEILSTLAISEITFFIFDPFMHYMPGQHITDLIHKMIYHYAEFIPNTMSFNTIIDISWIALASFLCALYFLFKKEANLYPRKFILGIISLSIILYTIFLTSHYKAERYFIPIILVWEVLLPLYLFTLIPKINITLKEGQDRNKINTTLEIITCVFLFILQAIPVIYIIQAAALLDIQ